MAHPYLSPGACPELPAPVGARAGGQQAFAFEAVRDEDTSWSRGLSPSAEQRLPGCGGSAACSRASTAESVGWVGGGPEGSCGAARRSPRASTAQFPAKPPPESGVRARDVLLFLGWLCCS
ncbi:unnamed protein product [Prorocentrum cordatum]|uniref:Uncharacterized protein n=1 Tax=Prorocentrum cordatum TaxID=2364126 RepID=A0ABN9QAJ8_9DINO|nr:unnamed protein product [Polarella glacialis]